MVFSNKYFEENHKLFTKYLNEDFYFENMYAIIRNIKVIGKIDNTHDIYNKYKSLQNSICNSNIEIHKTDIIRFTNNQINT